MTRMAGAGRARPHHARARAVVHCFWATDPRTRVASSPRLPPTSTPQIDRDSADDATIVDALMSADGSTILDALMLADDSAFDALMADDAAPSAVR